MLWVGDRCPGYERRCCLMFVSAFMKRFVELKEIVDYKSIKDDDDDWWNDECESCFEHTENAHHFVIEWQTGSISSFSFFIDHTRRE